MSEFLHFWSNTRYIPCEFIALRHFAVVKTPDLSQVFSWNIFHGTWIIRSQDWKELTRQLENSSGTSVGTMREVKCQPVTFISIYFFFWVTRVWTSQKNLMIFSLDNLCLIFSFTSGTSIWILLDLYTLAPLFLWVSWSYFVLHRILILQSNKVKESQLLNSKISVAMDGRERTGRLLPKHENSIL